MKSIEVTLKLLEALASEESGISVLDIARKISYSKSTTHRALQILEKEQFAEKVPLSERYRHGPRMLKLAFSFISRFDLRNLARPVLQNIVDQVNETVFLCVYSQKELLFADVIECAHPVRYINPLGKRSYLHAGAPGKVILAYLSDENIDQVIAKGLPAFTPKTITDPKKLKIELKQIRKNGFAISDGEFTEGGKAIAAPIISNESTVIGCVDMVIPSERFDKNKRELYVAIIKEGARKISQMMIENLHY